MRTRSLSKLGKGYVAWIFNFDSLQALSDMDFRGEKFFPFHLKPIKSDFLIADKNSSLNLSLNKANRHKLRALS